MALQSSQATAADIGDAATHGSALAALGSAALSGDPLDLLFEGACALVRDVAGADRVEIVVPSGRGHAFRVAAVWGAGDTDKGSSLEVRGGSVLGWCFTAEETVRIVDIHTDSRFLIRDELVDIGVRSVLAVPVPGPITPFGVVAAYSAAPDAFGSENVAFVEHAAAIIGAAIRRDREVTNLTERARQTQRNAQFHEALAACARTLLTLTDDNGLERALRALLAASEADYAYARRNWTDDAGRLRVRTVAAAYAESVEKDAAADPYWDDLAWSQMPTVRRSLEAGSEHIVIPERLAGEEGVLYLQSPFPIRSQLDIPIFVEGGWVGHIGLADATSLLEWSAADLLLLRAAADMVGAFWQRTQAREALEDVLRSKNEFLATVSHELRTPLTSILGMADELRSGYETFEPELRHEILETIRDESLDMSYLIEDLLAAARVDAGKLTVNQVHVDLRAEVDRILGELKDVRDTPVDGEADAWGDDFRVRQIIRNLLTNAVRYGGPQRTISITRFGAQSVVSVCDNGEGVVSGDVERVFRAFERGPQLIGNPQPIGLGLAVSRELARLMGGDLTYDHADGWCTFSLTLPHTESDAAAVRPAEVFPIGD